MICILDQHLIFVPILASSLLPLWGRCPFAVWSHPPAGCGSCLLLASLESDSVVSLQLELPILLCQYPPLDSSTHSKVICYWRNRRRNVPPLSCPSQPPSPRNDQPLCIHSQSSHHLALAPILVLIPAWENAARSHHYTAVYIQTFAAGMFQGSLCSETAHKATEEVWHSLFSSLSQGLKRLDFPLFFVERYFKQL